MADEVFETKLENLEEGFKDHESRLRFLEKLTGDIVGRLTNIEKNQADTKYLVLQSNVDNGKQMKEFADKIFGLLETQMKGKQEVKLTDRKGFWAFISALVAGVIGWFSRGGN